MGLRWGGATYTIRRVISDEVSGFADLRIEKQLSRGPVADFWVHWCTNKMYLIIVCLNSLFSGCLGCRRAWFRALSCRMSSNANITSCGCFMVNLL